MPKPKSGKKLVHLVVSIPEDVKKMLKEKSKEVDLTMSQIIRRLIIKHLDEF